MEGKRKWDFMTDPPPETCDEANKLAMEWIEDDEIHRSPVNIGIALGKLQEKAWVKKCFEVANDQQRVVLINQLLGDEFPTAFGQPDGPLGQAIFYEFESDWPDDSTD